MISNHIHDALRQVHTLQELIVARQKFRGYSGKARIVCGCTALTAAVILAKFAEDNINAHLIGWGIVLAISLAINYICLLTWFLSDQKVKSNPHLLKPAIDAVPALAVGAVISLTLILHQQYDLLPGVWMMLYGLAQVAYRNSLDTGIYVVGIAYIIAGATFILIPNLSFTNPWPMGITFFTGEICGGLIMQRSITNSQITSEGESL
jgi:hypothetical protein